MKLQANLLRYLVVIVLGIVISSLFPRLTVNIEIAKLLFGVAGIFFPVSLAVITSMDLYRVKNTEARREIRGNLRDQRNGLCFHFIMAMIGLITIYLIPDGGGIIGPSIIGFISINTPLVVTLIICESILYMTITFTSTQKLREDIEDKLDEEERRRKHRE